MLCLFYVTGGYSQALLFYIDAGMASWPSSKDAYVHLSIVDSRNSMERNTPIVIT